MSEASNDDEIYQRFCGESMDSQEINEETISQQEITLNRLFGIIRAKKDISFQMVTKGLEISRSLLGNLIYLELRIRGKEDRPWYNRMQRLTEESIDTLEEIIDSLDEMVDLITDVVM